MNNWFTVHDPHPDTDKVGWHIYLQDRYKTIAEKISIGDRVFFYEIKTSRQLKFKNCYGKMGVVHVGIVIGERRRRKTIDAISEYKNGEKKNWSTVIPTNADQSSGFIPRSKVAEILGYSKNYYFRGFARGKGIKQIEDNQANKLFLLFTK